MSGVPGPVIRGDERGVELRAGFDPEDGAFAQRLQIYRAIDDDTVARAQVQWRDSKGTPPEADFVQLQIWHQLSPDGPDNGWQTGVRLDLRLEAEGPPGRVAVSWLNQVRLDENLEARLFLQGAVQAGQEAQPGILLQSRASIRKSLGKLSVSVEEFSEFGSTSNIYALADQSHQAGPFGSLTFGNGWTVHGGVLWGLTRSSDAANIRLWISRTY